MRNKAVSILWRGLIGAKDTWANVIVADNKRIRPGVVEIDGKEVPVTGGRFYLCWSEGAKRYKKSVGTNPMKALEEKKDQEARLRLGQTQASQPQAPQAQPGQGKTLAEAVAAYLQEVKDHRKPKTLSAYRTALTYFEESCSKE